MALIGRTSSPVGTSPGNSRGPSRTGGSSIGHDATTNTNGSYTQQQQGQQTGSGGNNGGQWAGSNIPIIGGLGNIIAGGTNTLGQVGGNINNTAIDLSAALDKVARWLPAIVIILVAAIAIGHLRGGNIKIGG